MKWKIYLLILVFIANLIVGYIVASCLEEQKVFYFILRQFINASIGFLIGIEICYDIINGVKKNDN